MAAIILIGCGDSATSSYTLATVEQLRNSTRPLYVAVNNYSGTSSTQTVSSGTSSWFDTYYAPEIAKDEAEFDALDEIIATQKGWRPYIQKASRPVVISRPIVARRLMYSKSGWVATKGKIKRGWNKKRI
jgi:hypothetical protein